MSTLTPRHGYVPELSQFYSEAGQITGGWAVKAVFARLPSSVDARIRGFAIATLVAQILIVGTGGAVRVRGAR